MTGRAIRVLHLRDSPWVDGPGRTILETASHIDPARVEYHIGVFVSGTGPHPMMESAVSRRVNVHAIPDERGVSIALQDRVLDLVDRLRIDVLHTSDVRSNLLGLLCRRRRKMYLVSTAHGWITNTLRAKLFVLMDRILLRRFDRVVLVSHAMRRRLPRWWVPDSRLEVIHNALTLDSYGRDVLDVERRIPDPRRDVRLLNVGRLSPEKGQELLIQAVAGLTAEFPGLKLSFAGVGPLEARLRAAAGAHGIAERVEFLGFVKDMPALYQDYDLVVQSSFTEGLPNVMLEVAYLGVPVVATDVGGTREVVNHDMSGWLVPPRSLAALQDGIRRYLADPESFVRMARVGRRKIESEFSFVARTEAQTRMYERLVGAI